jgi:two-component sensor histidine kinase/DNA-binding response OmpR family regulator
MDTLNVLIVSHDDERGAALESSMKKNGHQIDSRLAEPGEALQHCHTRKPELIVFDWREEHASPPVKLLKELHLKAEAPLVLLLSPRTLQQQDLPAALPPLTCIIRAFHDTELRAALELSLHRRKLLREVSSLEQCLTGFSEDAPLTRGLRDELISPEPELCRTAREHFAETILTPHLSMDTLPFAVLLIKPTTREIVYTNKAAQDMGACMGDTCHQSWAKCEEPCSFCLAPELWSGGMPQYVEAEARGRVWGCYGEPLRQDLYLHYIMDITARREAEAKIARSLQEKEVLLRELHHRVKNNLQSILSLLNLQANFIDDSRLKPKIRELQNRIKSIALIHDRIYKSDNLTQIDFVKYLRNITTYLTRTFEKNNITIDIHSTREALLDLDTAFPLALIVNELVSNALTHAFCDDKGGTITIRFEEEGEKKILTIADDGAGIPEDVKFHSPVTLGLQLIQELTDQLDGTITMERAGGVSVSLTFKAPQHKPGHEM